MIAEQLSVAGSLGRARMSPMGLPFDSRQIREFEFGAGGRRLGCKFLPDGSMLFVHETQIDREIEQIIASLGASTEGLSDACKNLAGITQACHCQSCS
jgi:hypothetical protein